MKSDYRWKARLVEPGWVLGSFLVVDVLKTKTRRGYSTTLLLQCECGELKHLRPATILNGNTRSCGCFRREKTRASTVTHGLSKTKVYSCFAQARDRCENPKNKSYDRYGLRGIKFEWETFEEFFRDMGHPPSKKHHLDRIDNNSNYNKLNCQWVLPIENNRNTRQCFYWFIGEKRFTSLSEAAEATGVSFGTLHSRFISVNFTEYRREKKYP